MLFWLFLTVIVVAAGAAGLACGARRRHALRSVSALAGLAILGYGSYIAWMFAWQASCPHCTVTTQDDRTDIFALAVVFAGFYLLVVLAALGVFAAIGHLLRPRRGRLAS